MPYITSERVAEIRSQIKKEFPDYKFSITRDNHSSVNVVILAAPFNLLEGEGEDKTRASVNTYWIGEHYKDKPQIKEVLSKIHSIMNQGNGTLCEDGDYGTVPNFYTNLSIGAWDKPFQVIEATKPIKEAVKQVAPVETKTGEVKVIAYGEKAIAVIGDTYPIKDKLRDLGGKFNRFLSCGAGWVFPRTKLTELQTALTA